MNYQTKKLDREFQQNGYKRSSFSQETDYVICCGCGGTVERANMSAHHVIPRTFREWRHDYKNRVDLCHECHSECESIGNVRFAIAHEHKLLLYNPYAYKLLISNGDILR